MQMLGHPLYISSVLALAVCAATCIAAAPPPVNSTMAKPSIRSRVPPATMAPPTLSPDSFGHAFVVRTDIGVIPPGTSKVMGGGLLSTAVDSDWFYFHFGASTTVTVTLSDVTSPSDFDLSVYGPNATLLTLSPVRGSGPKSVVLRDDGNHGYTIRISAHTWDAWHPNFKVTFQGQ